jgi:hypothetical protein
MSTQLRRSSRRKRPTPIAAAAAARKRVRTPDVVTTVAESVNAETTPASSRVVVPSSGAQYWLSQVIPATLTTTGSIPDFSGFLYLVFEHYCLTIKLLNLCIHFFVFFLLLLVKFKRLYLHGNYSLD